MWSLRLVARPTGQATGVHAVGAVAAPGEEPHFRRTLVLQDVDDRSVFCWMADGDEASDWESLLDSSTFRALKGAAEVLGTIEELRVLQSDPPRGMRES